VDLALLEVKPLPEVVERRRADRVLLFDGDAAERVDECGNSSKSTSTRVVDLEPVAEESPRRS
jgi:hypothetical protein